MTAILFILEIIGCMIFPLSICWDECTLPKWYACGIALCLLLFFFSTQNSTIYHHRMKTTMRKSIPLAASSGILYESIWVICQIIHNGVVILRNGICGTFDNPCGLSTSICILLPLVFLNCSIKNQSNYIDWKHQGKLVWGSKILITALAIILVLLSQSRTGLISLVMMVVIVVYKYAPARYGQLDSMMQRPPYFWVADYRKSYFLYNYSYELFTTVQFEKAYEKSKECAVYMNDYDLELLTGDICAHRQNSDKALRHYISAYHMCPVRFAPLYGMFCFYRTKRDTIHADSVAWLIKNKPVKIQSSEVIGIKEEAIDFWDAMRNTKNRF